MQTSNIQNLYKWLYNGPHEVMSTAPTGFSITVRNIAFEKELREKPDQHDPEIIKNLTQSPNHLDRDDTT